MYPSRTVQFMKNIQRTRMLLISVAHVHQFDANKYGCAGGNEHNLNKRASSFIS